MATKKAVSKRKKASKAKPRKRGATRGATKPSQVALSETASDLSPSAYAKARGVSRQAVAKAIEEGRLRRSVHKVGSRWRIDPTLADEEWGGSTLPRKEVPADQPRAELAPLGDRRRPSMPLVDAKTLTEESRAELEEIKLAQLRGELIHVDKVERLFLTLARETRDAIIRVASRVAAQMAAETKPERCEVLLEGHLVEALEELAASRLAEGGV